MARPRRCRKICTEPAYDSFKPEGISVGEEITMTVDEYEVIRLVDLEKYTHEQCAERMGISRTTVTIIRKYTVPHTNMVTPVASITVVKRNTDVPEMVKINRK